MKETPVVHVRGDLLESFDRLLDVKVISITAVVVIVIPKHAISSCRTDSVELFVMYLEAGVRKA